MNSQSAFGTPLLSTPAPLNAAPAVRSRRRPAANAAPAVTPGDRAGDRPPPRTR